MLQVLTRGNTPTAASAARHQLRFHKCACAATTMERQQQLPPGRVRLLGCHAHMLGPIPGYVQGLYPYCASFPLAHASDQGFSSVLPPTVQQSNPHRPHLPTLPIHPVLGPTSGAFSPALSPPPFVIMRPPSASAFCCAAAAACRACTPQHA